MTLPFEDQQTDLEAEIIHVLHPERLIRSRTDVKSVWNFIIFKHHAAPWPSILRTWESLAQCQGRRKCLPTQCTKFIVLTATPRNWEWSWSKNMCTNGLVSHWDRSLYRYALLKRIVLIFNELIHPVSPIQLILFSPSQGHNHTK